MIQNNLSAIPLRCNVAWIKDVTRCSATVLEACPTPSHLGRTDHVPQQTFVHNVFHALSTISQSAEIVEEVSVHFFEFSEIESDSGKLSYFNLDSDEDKRLSESDCEESEESTGTPIDADLREQNLKLGPYQPEGNFQKDAKGRSFSSSYCSFMSKAGQKIERKWLCYSTRLRVAYCQALLRRKSDCKSLESDVLNFLNTLDINLAKCRRQGYDGAANMSGAYGGLQKLRTNNQEQITFTAQHTTSTLF
ncbi:hypothetical protein TNCV_490741 [Trichonephila clavipes]|nr:hypothetical protein TNCV_490741 [Trichonephila clavipes]